nr:uncharacterized protein LOC113737442 [Coffea arabica]
MAACGPSDKLPDSGTSVLRSFASVLADGTKQTDALALGEVSTFRGEPALRISRREIEQLSVPFQNSLKHVLIRPVLEEDYTRLFARRIWYVSSSPMSISKWSLEFKADQELSIAPIWVCFPELPIPFFQQTQLFKLASTLGRPLKIDASTSDMRRPSVARVLVELNFASNPVRRIWIGDENFGFWQPVEMETWPSYYGFSSRFGPAEEQCFHKNPFLRSDPPIHKVPSKTQKQRQIYVPKVVNEKEKELEVTTVQSKPAADVNKEQGMSAAHAQTIPEAATLGNNSQFVLDSINPDDFQLNIGQNHKGKAAKSVIVTDRVVVPEHGTDVGLQTSTSNPLEDGEFTDPESENDHSIQPANGAFTEAASEEKAMEVGDSS